MHASRSHHLDCAGVVQAFGLSKRHFKTDRLDRRAPGPMWPGVPAELVRGSTPAEWLSVGPALSLALGTAATEALA